ncbi:MAG: ribulose-phosphate 3-epimerase [Candidatus Caldatribacterium sp.]|uniref:ribulose-phosphate 3-epimerase n=1 Tax=Candidatus Caldatribacterium sp. TaxID=2282143 RepID=UPI0029988FE5|nr:ribulose-phosphate 3-epimerase [Candidatus Caldatribacterium sp.]MCX7730810.1 ribulose-phosphate 3-epimerase [Candidatus Caldatribacterium sp.]MDW8081205.1 ribulose-phosphate 3-epimerase [Candidatus Calescibacterium sp.]
MKDVKISASLDCANFLALLEDVRKLERGGVDMLHIDIMDGIFVPNFALGTNLLKKLRPVTRLPFDVHLMVVNPEPHFALFAQLGADWITFHAEGNARLHHLALAVKRLGKRVGIALNPATDPGFLRYLLPYVDLVLCMTVDPGFVGQKFIPEVVAKIRTVRDIAQELGVEVDIAVDGGISEETVPLLKKAGANIFVAGTSSIFSGKEDLEVAARRFGEFCRST